MSLSSHLSSGMLKRIQLSCLPAVFSGLPLAVQRSGLLWKDETCVCACMCVREKKWGGGGGNLLPLIAGDPRGHKACHVRGWESAASSFWVS